MPLIAFIYLVLAMVTLTSPSKRLNTGPRYLPNKAFYQQRGESEGFPYYLCRRLGGGMEIIMKYLLPNYWDRFFKNNNGQLFEQLCLNLLQFMYPNEEWHQTSSSWDGKKDFFADINIGGISQIKCWAECKCHTDNLSIDIISSTLVVGTLENAGIIIFFSYSPMNENATEYLAFFKEKTGKQILVFDDVKLEELIIQYYDKSQKPEIIEKFFPDFLFEKFKRTDSAIEPVRYHYFLSNPYNHNIFKKYSKDFYRVNDVFIVNYFFENTSITEKVKIDIQINYDVLNHKYLQFLNQKNLQKSHQITLNPGEVKYIQCKYKLISYRHNIILPSIEYNIKGQTFRPYQKSLKGKWLADTTLIGGSYISIVTDHQSLLSADNVDNYCFSTLYGESGTGKSRLLKEICDNAIIEGYDIFRYNGEYQISNNEEWVKSYLSLAYALPYQKKSYSILTDFYDEEKKELISILYDENYDFTVKHNTIKEFMLKQLLGNKHLLVFDNIQFFSDNTLRLINDFITFANNNACNFKILLTFNTDYIFPKTESKKLFDRLMWLEKEEKNHYYISHVSGFNQEQARIYVSSCLNCINVKKSYQFTETIKLLIDKAGILPLSIEQTLFYLIQKEVLIREEDYFIISNLDLFHQTLEKIPSDLKQVLSKRLEIIAEQMECSAQIFNYLSLLTFMQEVDSQFLIQFGVDFSIIEIMIDMGLIRYTDDETYIIYHNILKRFFKERFKKNIYEISKSIVNIIENNDLQDDYPLQYVISKSHMDRSEKLLQFAIRQLLASYKCHDLQKEFDKEVQRMFFTTLRDRNISREHLKAAKILCYHSQIYNTYDTCIKTYNDFNERFFVKYESCYLFGEEFVDFIREFANVYILLRQEVNCRDLINEVLQQWDKLSFKNNNSKMKMYGLLLTRKCVILKSLNILEEAKNVAEETIEIANKINDDELFIRISFDYGYIYYNSFFERGNTKLHWENAYIRYQKSTNKNLFKMQGSVFYHEALVKAMFFEYDEAINLAQNALNFFEINEKTPYYKTKLYLLLATIYLIKANSGIPYFYEQAKENLEIAEDLAVAFHSNRIYYKCLYLKAKYFFSQERFSDCNIYLNQCLQEMYLYINDVTQEKRYSDLIFDIYYMKRFYQNELSVYEGIKNVDILREIRKLYRMNNEQWNTYCYNFKASSIITSPLQDMNYPKP